MNPTGDLRTNENVVDGNVNELYKIPNQAHNNETNSRGSRSLSEFYS